MDDEVLVEITSEEGIAVVAFKSASIISPQAIANVSKQVKAFIDENHPNTIVFDFEQVKFFSSQVLGVLLDIRAGLENRNGEIAISGINPQLHRVFKITNLDTVFRFFPDAKSAIREIANR